MSSSDGFSDPTTHGSLVVQYRGTRILDCELAGSLTPPHPANCRGEPYHRGQKNVELATHYSQFGFSHCSKENLSIGSVKELLDAYVTHGSVNVFKTIYFATSQNLGSSRTELRQLNLHQYLCILKSAGR